MGPSVDSMVFEPTPAMREDKENFGAFGNNFANKHFEAEDNPNKSVRFSEFPVITSPVRRAQSIATTQNIPLLEPISSASHMPRQSLRFRNAVPEIDMEAYIEHTRSVVEGQREGFEREKKAFDRERKMWQTERTMLKSKIADLEFKLNKAKDGKRRYSNESSATTTGQSFRSDYGSFSAGKTNCPSISRIPSEEKESTSHAVWEGPESPTPVTRVFSNEDQNKAFSNHLPSISEDEAISAEALSGSVSPRTEPAVIPIPIETIDKSLDGITLKSTALAPSFVARVTSQTASPAQSPSPRPRTEGNLQIGMNNLLSPLDEKLKRHAGHTPMAFGEGNGSTTGNSTEQITPRQEEPPAPAPSARPPLRPSENSDSYFSFITESKEEKSEELEAAEDKRRADVRRGTLSNSRPILHTEDTDDLDEDPALQGPLMLDPSAKLKSSDSFLDLVDAKLYAEIKQNPQVSEDPVQTAAVISGGASPNDIVDDENMEADLEMPRLRMKRSMNFGSAWGSGMPSKRLS